MAKSTTKPNNKTSIADAEYKRLIDLYTQAGADEIKIKVNDELIRKVAELFADLETIKTLPLLIFDKRNPTIQKETAAGKMRVKYMAQYVAAMQKLNKDMLGALNNDDDTDLDKYE
jgi:hypothetical protein